MRRGGPWRAGVRELPYLRQLTPSGLARHLISPLHQALGRFFSKEGPRESVKNTTSKNTVPGKSLIKDTLTKVLLMRKREHLFVMDQEGTREVSTLSCSLPVTPGTVQGAEGRNGGMQCHQRGTRLPGAWCSFLLRG